jgi:hypothetical protein
MSLPPSGSKNKPSTLVSCMVSLTLKIEPTCSSETSVDFQRVILPYIQGDKTLQEGIKFHVLTAVTMNNNIFWDVISCSRDGSLSKFQRNASEMVLFMIIYVHSI